MLALVLLLALVIGVTLGLFGGGGSILMVPLLLYVAGMDAQHAIATSLFVVGATAVVALIPHARAAHVHWRTGLVFGGASMVGAFAGGRLGSHIPAPILTGAFAVVMIAASAAMIRGRTDLRPPRAHPRLVPSLLQGAGVGLVTGLVGAGGGFIIVPALVLLGGLEITAAVGTSLLVIALNSGAALAGYLSVVTIDWGVALPVAGAAIAGSLIGAHVAPRVDADRLRRGFGVFVLGMGALVLVRTAMGA